MDSILSSITRRITINPISARSRKQLTVVVVVVVVVGGAEA